MKARTLFAICAIVLFNLPSISAAQALRPDLMYCGSTSRQGADLYSGVGPFNEVFSCTPDGDTQALLITRSSGSVAGNGAAWLAYLNAGGVIITEYSNSHVVYNEIYGTAYPYDGAQRGDCQDNAMPAVKLNPGHQFWQDNAGLTETPENLEGCGHDMTAIVDGEAEVTALGGWYGTPYISFAIRPQGAGVFWILEADWFDGQDSYSEGSKDFMAVLISGGTYSVGQDAPVPALSSIGLMLLAMGLVYLGMRRRIHA